MQFIEKHFIPVRVHVKENAQDFQRLGQRFDAMWTPTILELAPDGTEVHRIEGFLPADDFLAQLRLGLARSAMKRNDWGDAEQRFRRIVERHPETEAAPEALYWAGVSKYKGTNDPKALGETAAAFKARYEDTAWAKKASVWS